MAQSIRASQIVLESRSASRLSGADEAIIYRDADDGQVKISRGGAAFTELAEAAGGSPSWVTRAFNAANYSAGGSMTFTVDALDIVTETWQLIHPDTAVLNFNIFPASIGGTPHTDLLITMPFVSAVTLRVPFVWGTNPLGTNGSGTGWALVNAASNVLTLQKQGFTTWANDANSVFLQGIVGPFKITP